MVLVTFAGCISEEFPRWINQLPESDSELCAIGVSGPTFYAEDARTKSISLAKTELARTLEVKIKSQMLLRSEGDHRSFSTSIDEMASFDTDVVLKNAQVREQWIHPGNNKQYGGKGTVYTLLCMPIQT
jgi:hypothetical protein